MKFKTVHFRLLLGSPSVLFVRVIQIIFFLFLMADVPELHLVQNRCGGTSLVYEGRIYKLKRAGRQKYWRCSK
ncbi:hypothetical protein T09_10080, partial [Trichinella sp. T9]